MARALELARSGIALAHPNPRVGAIVVKNGETVGEGFHVSTTNSTCAQGASSRTEMKPGKKARGAAALYVMLEGPCCTTGRTGPCHKSNSRRRRQTLSSRRCEIQIPKYQAVASQN